VAYFSTASAFNACNSASVTIERCLFYSLDFDFITNFFYHRKFYHFNGFVIFFSQQSDFLYDLIGNKKVTSIVDLAIKENAQIPNFLFEQF